MGEPDAQREALKVVATTLKAAKIRFALAGSYAGWARGAPEGRHDVDFVVHPDDLEKAANALLDGDARRVDAPEDWLFKIVVGGVVVDLIHILPMGPVDDDMLKRATRVAVESVKMPVLSVTDLLVSKLLALNDRSCDLGPPLLLARAIREQVDWRLVGKLTEGNPYAHCFLVLCTDLSIIEEGAA